MQIDSYIKSVTGASHVTQIETIQELWSGYGNIVRYRVSDVSYNTVIVKHVNLPKGSNHPRGWNTDLSHQRKLKSYEVETCWYQEYSSLLDAHSKVPDIYGITSEQNEVVMVMEDLDESGFEARKSRVTLDEMYLCLDWLAHFHARFLGVAPDGLWESGTYWHLETRPDELDVLSDVRLKGAASKIDQILKTSPYQTFVHGDAKLANFCFAPDSRKVAAVDFQYIGGGCGMKDVAYFIGSCLYEEDCEKYENTLLKRYFASLADAVQRYDKDLDLKDLESNWREMYPFAWTDFHRFIKGWSPGHWKIHSYSERLALKVIESL